KFLALYHTRYARPLKDHLVAALEPLLPLAARAPRLSNAVLANPLARLILARAGLVAIPALSPVALAARLAESGVAVATSDALARLDAQERARS
ncbi:hypothetical protein INQ30_26560, partial [Escherichia coli]|nr:hypothetical protein [Escherichia coli]